MASEPTPRTRPPAPAMSSLQLGSFNNLASFLAEAHRTLAEEQQYCTSLSALVSEAEHEQEQRQSRVAELHTSIEQLRQRCAQLQPTKAGLECSVVGARSSSERAEQALQQQGLDLEELRARLQETTEGLMTKKRHAEARFPAQCIAAAAELRRVQQERQRLLQLRPASLQEGRHRREEAWLLLRGRLVALAAAVVRVRRVDHDPRYVFPTLLCNLAHLPSVWQEGHGRTPALTSMDTSPGTTCVQHPGKPNFTIPPVLRSKYFNEQPSSRRKNLHVSFNLQEEPLRRTTNSAAWTVQGAVNDGCQDESDMEVDHPRGSPEIARSLEYSPLDNPGTSTPARTNCSSALFFRKDPCQSTPAGNDSGFSEVTPQSRPASRHTLPLRHQSEEDITLENKSTRSPSQFSTVSLAGNIPSSTAPDSDSWKNGAEPSDGAGRRRSSRPDTPAQPRSRSLSRLTLPGLKFRFSSSRDPSAERFSPSTKTTGGGPFAGAEGNGRLSGGVQERSSSSSFFSTNPHRSEARGRAGVGKGSLQPADDNPCRAMATTSSPVLASTTLSSACTTPPSIVQFSETSSSLSSLLTSSSPSLASLAPSSSPQAPSTAPSSSSIGTSTVSSSPYFSGLLASGRSTNWRNAFKQSRPSFKPSTITKMCSAGVSERFPADHNTTSTRNSSKQPNAAGSFPINSNSEGSSNQSDEVGTAAPPSAAKDNIAGTKRTGVQEEVADCDASSTGQEKRSLMEMDEDMMDVTEQEIQRLEESYKSFLQRGSPGQQIEDDIGVAMETEEEASLSSSIGVEAGKEVRKKDTQTVIPSDCSTSKAAAQHTKKHAFSFKRISEELTSTVTIVAHTSSSTVTTHSNTGISTAIAPTTSFTSTSTVSCSQAISPGAPLSTSSSSAVPLSTEEILVQASSHAVAVAKNPSSNAPSISSTSFSSYMSAVSRPSMSKFTIAASSTTSATFPASSYVGCVSSSQAVSAAVQFPSPSALPASSESIIGRSTPSLKPAACSTPQFSAHILSCAFPRPPCSPLLPIFVSPRTTPQTFTSPRSTPQTFASPRPASQLTPSHRPRRPSPSPPSPRISIGSFQMTSPRPPLPVATQSIHQLSPRPSRSPSPRNPLSSLPKTSSPSRLPTASFGPASSAGCADRLAHNGNAPFSQPSPLGQAGGGHVNPTMMMSPSGQAGGGHVNPTMLMSPSGLAGGGHVNPTMMMSPSEQARRGQGNPTMMMMSPLLPGRGSPASMLAAGGSAYPVGQQRQQPRDQTMFSPLFGAFAGGRSESNSPAGDSGSGFLLGGVPSQQQQPFSLFGSPLHHNGANSLGVVTSAAAPHPFSLFGDSAGNTSLDQASSSQGSTPGTGGFFSFGGGDDSGGGGGRSFFSSLFGGRDDGGGEEDATDSAAAFRIF